MIKIAITGNIAAGKSAAEKLLSEQNFSVADTDKITHFLLENSKEVNEKISYCFKGYDIFKESRNIDRQKLGKIVFNNKELLKKLEDIVHPAVIDEINLFFEKNTDKNAVFVSVPLLYECNLSHIFDKVILIYANDNIRKKRLTEKRGFSPEDAENRMKSQMPQEEKIKSADFVIYNNSDLLNFSKQLNSVIKEIINR